MPDVLFVVLNGISGHVYSGVEVVGFRVMMLAPQQDGNFGRKKGSVIKESNILSFNDK